MTTGGSDIGVVKDDNGDNDSGLMHNASGEPIEVKASCYGVYERFGHGRRISLALVKAMFMFAE